MADVLMHAMTRSPFADVRMQALASTGFGNPPGCQKNEKNETALEGGPGLWRDQWSSGSSSLTEIEGGARV